VDETPDGLLGSGALGVVRRGTLRLPSGVSKPVAVKAYPTGMNEAATRREFELLMMAGKRCTHTVRTFGMVVRNDRLCIVMQLYPETLEQKVRREGPMPYLRALQMTHDLFVAIAELHEHGIVSRDIKGSNVMLDKHGGMFLSDFGISVQLRETMGLHKPTDGAMQGTFDHLGPEGFTPAAFGGVGPALDVWAGACVAQLLFTGQGPFPGLNLFEVFQQVGEHNKKIKIKKQKKKQWEKKKKILKSSSSAVYFFR
jgi:serine/threonine protein kinase